MDRILLSILFLQSTVNLDQNSADLRVLLVGKIKLACQIFHCCSPLSHIGFSIRIFFCTVKRKYAIVT